MDMLGPWEFLSKSSGHPSAVSNHERQTEKSVRFAFPVFRRANFSREAAIRENGVTRHERHPNHPPDEADLQPVIRRLRVGSSQTIKWIRARGEHVGIEAEGDAREHSRQV